VAMSSGVSQSLPLAGEGGIIGHSALKRSSGDRRHSELPLGMPRLPRNGRGR
jgi:hypothetical protein